MLDLHRLILLSLRSPIAEVATVVEVLHEVGVIGIVAEAAHSLTSDLMLDSGADLRKVKAAGVLGTGTSARHITLILVCGTVLERSVSCFLHANHRAIPVISPIATLVQSSIGRAPWRTRPCQLQHSRPSPLRSLHLLLCSAPYVLPRPPMLRKHRRLVPGLSSKSGRIDLARPPILSVILGHLHLGPRTPLAPRFRPALVPKVPIFNRRSGILSRCRNSLDRLVDSGSTLHSPPRAA